MSDEINIKPKINRKSGVCREVKILRVPVDNSYEILQEEVKKLYVNVSMFYIDEDGDHLPINCQEDLSDAIEEFGHRKVKIYLSKKADV